MVTMKMKERFTKLRENTHYNTLTDKRQKLNYTYFSIKKSKQ